jgi:SHS family lactate transporter-like MFS transporter
MKMGLVSALRELDTPQRHVVAASFLGWTLDAFDYFLLVFVIPEVAREFGASFAEVFFSTTLTLPTVSGGARS